MRVKREKRESDECDSGESDQCDKNVVLSVGSSRGFE